MQEIYTNNAGHQFIIVNHFQKQGNTKTYNKVFVKFLSTGTIKEAFLENVLAGKVKDPYAPSKLGIGYLGEFEKVSYWKQAFQLWNNVMTRCYSDKHAKGYLKKGTTVDARWLCFANFLHDLPTLKNFDKWLSYQLTKTGEKYNLDKDLQGLGHLNTYSVYTCGFETEFINKGAARRGKKFKSGKEVTNPC